MCVTIQWKPRGFGPATRPVLGGLQGLDTPPARDPSIIQTKRPSPPAPRRDDPLGRVLRILFALGIAVTTAWFVYDRFFIVSTYTAVLAGRTIILRAPIDGRLDMPLMLPGEHLREASVFGVIVNDRADTRRMAELRATMATVEGELLALQQRAGGTAILLRDATGTAEAFRRTRVEQIAARVAESESLLRATDARLREATLAAGRGQTLLRQGFSAQAAADTLRRDLDVARDQQQAAADRRDVILVEQAGAAAGIFATDNATDRSASQQTMDRLSLILVEVEAMIAERQARLPALRSQAAQEEELLGRQSRAPLVVPSDGAISRILAQPGEIVRAGQEVVRIAACGQPILTTELDDRNFRSVRVGQLAEFKPAGIRRAQRAEVLQLIPLSLTPGEARTRPQAILRLLGEPDSCEAGRMGEVRFLQ